MQTIIEKSKDFPTQENPNPMNIGDMYQRPGFLLRRANQISAGIFETSCATLGLTQAQYGALTILAHEPKIDQTRLAKALGFDKVTMLRVIRGLEDRGLVLRAPSSTSRKHLALYLSTAGTKLLRKASPSVQEAYERLMAPLTQSQQRQLVALLSRLTAGLEHEARAELAPIAGPTPQRSTDRSD